MKVVLILLLFSSDRDRAASSFEKIEGFSSVETCQQAARKYLDEMSRSIAGRIDFNCIEVK